MYQNINGNAINMEREKRFNIFSKVFVKENIIIYIVSFMLSLVGVGGEFSIFSLSMLGACFASAIPALGVVIVSLIGNLIKFGIQGAWMYFITSLVMLISLFIIKPRYNEQERNENIKIGKNVLIATLLVQCAKIFFGTFTWYGVFASITLAIVALVFYKIFVNSIVVVQEFMEKRAFSIEEVIGASLLMAIAVGAFGNAAIAGFGIKNILSILIVMVLGWKNGILVGTTSGVAIGVTLGAITGNEPIMIAAYAISGMIAGVLNRFGKIGVIVGFILGNITLAYVSNGYTVELIHFKEILVASIGLLLIPKTLHIDLEEFIGTDKYLPVAPDRALNRSKEMAENLNNVSDAIQEMATSFETEKIETEEKEGKEENKQIFITELLNDLEPYKENMLYDDIADTEGKIIDGIFELLLEKQEIEREDLLKIFAKCNSYIVGFEDKEISKYLEENISQMLRTINVSYKVSKANFIWRKKVKENNKHIGKQLNGVSKAIQKMAKNLEQDIENEEQYAKEKTEVIELLRKKDLAVKDMEIKHETRFLIEMYFDEILEIAKIKVIEKILTKVFKESIILNNELPVGKKLSFLSDDKFIMAIGDCTVTKSKSEVSGDSILSVRLKDGKYLIAISDGMGSGKEAKDSSAQALKMLENLLLSGFDKNISLELINTALMNKNEEIFATLDIAIVDLYAGNIEFIKSGACPTYIKNKKKVQMIKSSSLPTGIVGESNVETFNKEISSGDILLMCSDGILESNVEFKNKELWIKYMLEDIETNNTKKIADLLLNEAIDNNYGVAKDDMSVVVCRFVEKT